MIIVNRTGLGGSLEQMIAVLQQLQMSCGHISTRYSPDWFIHSGIETRTIPSQYYWHGLKRGGDPNYPYLVFQYTLSGAGQLEADGKVYEVMPGQAFTVVIPSDHAYYLPSTSSNWTFLYLVIRHPYVVARIAQRVKALGPVLSLAPDSVLITRAIQLFKGMSKELLYDEFAEEQSLFTFLIEYERCAHQLLFPPQREQLLHSVRTYVLRRLGHAINTSELASAFGFSRSHFSHYFRVKTGFAPAHFITYVRLEEVTHRLLHTDLRLDAIAAETGFANANHLCKVFRRHYHQSPTEFRRQIQHQPDL